ncbi:MAG: hypothetical protein CMJ64_23060 [Planctomycetaceae bacterium]|nr:hypothetical protein [Planctomycetaceae bacterium]
MLIALSVLIAIPADVESAPSSVRRQVREGLRQHSAGDFEAAAKSFGKAAGQLPEDPRVAYDQACALAAQRKRPEATSLFQRAASSRDAGVVASSHYNLGSLAVDEARELLGEQPADADPETREQVGKLIGQAVAHYRDCLRGNPEHVAARKNLEVLRLWLKHMQDVWARRDREKRREEMDLLQFLEWMTNEERVFEATAKTLDQLNSSPRQRQAIRQTEQAQRMLAEEVEPLQRKLDAAVRDAAGDTLDQASNNALAALNKLALQARSSMFRAADDLAVRSVPSAIEAQGEAIESLNDIYSSVAPFESTLQKATTTQSQLLETSKAVEEDEGSDALDVALLARDQRFVSGWAETLPAKAQMGLSQLPQTVEPPADNEEAQQAYQQQQAMKESYEKAIELAPKVVELTKAATDHVTNVEWTKAIPEQEEALKLLEEMAPKTPPQDQNDDQDQDGEQKKNEQQENKDQQDQDDQKKNSQDDQQKQDQQKKDEKKNGEQDQQQEKREQQLSRQQAEALLRKVRQRERDHREREKKLRALLQEAVPVDRDW